MRQRQSRFPPLVPILALAALLAACGGGADAPAQRVATVSIPTAPEAAAPSPAVPPLPFADNPDPTQCGIPTVWGLDDPAWITGHYRGEVVQPIVFLYDSHARREVVGHIPHGGRVRIVLTQANPTLDYYHVRSLDLRPEQSGWVPAPFVLLDAPPPPLPSSSSRGQHALDAPVVGTVLVAINHESIWHIPPKNAVTPASPSGTSGINHAGWYDPQDNGRQAQPGEQPTWTSSER